MKEVVAVETNKKEFAELMEEVANLEPRQQEAVTFFVQGFVAAAGTKKRETAAVN